MILNSVGYNFMHLLEILNKRKKFILICFTCTVSMMSQTASHGMEIKT